MGRTCNVIALLFSACLVTSQVCAEDRWCRIERVNTCEAEKCGPMQDMPSVGYDFRLSWETASGTGLRAYCQSGTCNYQPSPFSFNPGWPRTFFGKDGWLLDFPTGDNRFIGAQGVYTEDKGVRTPLVAVQFGYCSFVPYEVRP